MIFFMYLTTCLILIFTIFSKFIWPIILFHSQISSIFPIDHFSPLISLRTYTLFGVLIPFDINLPKSYFLISHSQELNMRLYPWSHIWITLRRLCFRYSIHKTFSILSLLLSKMRVPFPTIFNLSLSPKVTLPSFFFKVMKFVLSHFIWLEHSLLITHLSLFFWAQRFSWTNKDFSFFCSHLIFIIGETCLRLLLQ